MKTKLMAAMTTTQEGHHHKHQSLKQKFNIDLKVFLILYSDLKNVTKIKYDGK